MSENYLGQSIPKLGFGFMRLPLLEDGAIDFPQVYQMVDLFLERGFTYFDTAFGYLNQRSEGALKQAVVDRYPRERFQVATKLPMWEVHTPEDPARIFQTQLERTGAGYFDFYLHHNVNSENYDKSKEFDTWGYLKTRVADGTIRHFGMSFHDTAEYLDKVLTEQPQVEFVQLQINYADWENEKVQSRLCYEVARKHGKPVIVMEPVKGGSLATLTPELQQIFRSARPDWSMPSWAIRYAASLEGIVTVLSGMSTLEQVEDNTGYMQNFRPLNDEERQTVARAQEALKRQVSVPCTGCEYCVDGCPQKIAIPRIFGAMNELTVYGNEDGARRRFAGAVKDKGLPSSCIGCGQCESQCPQHIPVIAELAKAAERFE